VLVEQGPAALDGEDGGNADAIADATADVTADGGARAVGDVDEATSETPTSDMPTSDD